MKDKTYRFKGDKLLLDSTKKALESRKYQLETAEFIVKNEKVLITSDAGLGKAQPIDELILTPNGWIKIGDISPGDLVYNDDGAEIEVLSVHPQGIRPIYEVTFTDGSSTRCDLDHLWVVHSDNDIMRSNPWRTLSLREILDLGIRTPAGRLKWRIPMCDPVQHSHKKYDIDPYILGILLGDGSFRLQHQITFTTADLDIVNNITKRLPDGMKVVKVKGTKYDYRISNINPIHKLNSNIIIKSLKEMNLWGHLSHDKFIPKQYLIGSVEQRLDLLHGLMDSDGYASKDNLSEFYSSSPKLILGVQELVTSLGGTAKKHKKQTYYTHLEEKRKGRPSERLLVVLPNMMNPFSIKRKQKLVAKKRRLEPYRKIASVNYVNDAEAVCIKVNAINSLYLTKDHIVTHNTLSTIAGVIKSGITGTIVVFCPKIALLTWADEIEKWTDDSYVIAEGSTKQRSKIVNEYFQNLDMNKRTWLLCNIEMARESVLIDSYDEFIHNELGVCIIDESHRALCTDKMTKSKHTLVYKGFSLINAKYKIALSATPARGQAGRLLGTFRWLYPDKFNSSFLKKWMQPEFKSGSFGSIVTYPRVLPGKETEFNSFTNDLIIGFKKKDVAKDLPPIVKYDIYLKMEDEQSRAYEEIKELLATELEEGELKASSSLAKLTRLKQFASSYAQLDDEKVRPDLPSNKFEWIVDFLDQRGINKEPEGDSKIVIGSQFTQLINLFATELRSLGIPVHVITGQTVQSKREAITKDWQSDSTEVRVLLLNTMAAGVSLTLDKADEMIVIDETWVADDQEQLINRIHRISRVHNVSVYFLRSKGTIEEHIQGLNIQQVKNLKDIL